MISRCRGRPFGRDRLAQTGKGKELRAMPTAELPSVRMWYDERGQGEPCVMLHPGGAGVDSRALARRVVSAAGVFPHMGWAAGVLDGEPPEFLRQSYGELSPDGIGHYDVIVRKLADMHTSEPALTGADLRALTCRTLVIVAD